MNYLHALQLCHEMLAPSNYLEIGCRHGTSLALSRCPALGVDPAFELRRPARAEVQLFELTSDHFFATHDPSRILGEPIDFAFIDGMHLSEFALRDFMHIEKCSHATGVIAIDDILPDRLEYATRDRNTKIWTGDVYRTIRILRQYRPDLEIRVYAIEMKGFCLVNGLDPGNTAIADNLREIQSRIMAGDWEAPSHHALVEAMAPLPAERLAVDLGSIAARRAHAHPDA
jgi:hypothetical protein